MFEDFIEWIVYVGGMTLIVIILCVTTIYILEPSAKDRNEWKKQEQIQNIEAHKAWIKYTNRTDISFEEWMAMKNTNTLPQNTK